MLVAGVIDVTLAAVDATRLQRNALIPLDNHGGDDGNLSVLDVEARGVEADVEANAVATALHSIAVDGHAIVILGTNARNGCDTYGQNS